MTGTTYHAMYQIDLESPEDLDVVARVAIAAIGPVVIGEPVFTVSADRMSLRYEADTYATGRRAAAVALGAITPLVRAAFAVAFDVETDESLSEDDG